jgi:hypothetical protein
MFAYGAFRFGGILGGIHVAFLLPSPDRIEWESVLLISAAKTQKTPVGCPVSEIIIP